MFRRSKRIYYKIMEADSTTYENLKSLSYEPCLPFPTNTGNYKLYKDFITTNGERSLESQLIERLQEFGLIPKSIQCPSIKTECKVICKSARVIDRVQWVCEGCGKRQPIRLNSFFFRLQCSILQILQIILAWCEDADCEVAAEHFALTRICYNVIINKKELLRPIGKLFKNKILILDNTFTCNLMKQPGVKPKVASVIYDRLDDLAINEHMKYLLGGENSVVLAELYPDCVNRLSPDTTDQPHVHRILMLADTNHIPTYYRLQVIRDDPKAAKMSSDTQVLKSEVETIISQSTMPSSTIVSGNNLPIIDGASTMQHLVQYCDVEMQRFLTSRIWRQAITLCTASRELCARAGVGVGAGVGVVAGAGVGSRACAAAVQRYLDAALYRLRHGDGFYEHILNIVAAEYTGKNITANVI